MRAIILAVCAMFALAWPAMADTPPPSGEPEATPLAGTTWEGHLGWHTGEMRDAELYFRADGVLVYTYAGSRYDNGRWRQNGRVVTWDLNDDYAVSVGLVSNGAMSGSSYNTVGNSGVFALELVRD